MEIFAILSPMKMIKSLKLDYFSTHEEADSRIMFHVKKLPAPVNVVIRTVDTDVLVIALGCMHMLDQGKRIWVETGLCSKSFLVVITQLHLTEKERYAPAIIEKYIYARSSW